jgi:hypothetical protein
MNSSAHELGTILKIPVVTTASGSEGFELPVDAGYNIYVVEDCCGATSPTAHEAALSRMVQAGAVRLTTIPALLEWQRDWAKREHYNNLMGLLKPQAGAYGVGVEYAYTMVHHAPQSAVKPQVVPKKIAH